ncbi:putative transposase [Roseovarius nanhaiticus]|uniref:Putative transposase n=1 Tax=Roseovarius nanhaiticus TaxID=573024 RepID=A0A1N7F9M8_9RHOB|nr:putative transposase [Roseovarius nanhaiticus]SIR97029.1 putative transposase [Roseovarius nanhaiticus]
MRNQSPSQRGAIKRMRYSEEQIIVILTEHETGAKCADLYRKHGMAETLSPPLTI